MLSNLKLKVLAGGALVAAAAATGIAAAMSGGTATVDRPLTNASAPELTGISNWINSDPLTLQQLRGKVVLVDFWTYTCINCINTLPYVKSWNEKYKDQGLTVIGVHTPEYPFERDTGNVKTAVKRFGITYPVAQDNSYATWRAYGNEYWPAFYLIDKTGKIVYTHFGEGDYAKTEAEIQTLLAQKG
nr:thioredoxin family protein [Paraburkholderia ginsengiterrae]